MEEIKEMKRIYLTPLGIILKSNSTYKGIKFSSNLSDAAKYYNDILIGRLPPNINNEIKKFCNTDKVIEVASPLLYDALKSQGFRVRLVDRDKPIETLIIESGLETSIEKVWEKIKMIMDEVTRLKLKEDLAKRDLMIIHAINAYEEYTEIINMMYERLREWYGTYFPELADIVRKIDSYVNLIATITAKEDFELEKLLELGYAYERAEKIVKAASSSIGAYLEDSDLNVIKVYAQNLKRVIEAREYINNYLKNLVEEVAPNLNAIIGYKIAAKLIAKAGGLQKLAMLPASTIQLLGAEKALFRALRKGSKPPKHGYIFQHPYINQSPKKIRGRIARAMASKIAIAVRTDAFGGEYIGDKLAEDLKKKVDELRSKYVYIAKKKFRRRRR